MLSNLKVFLGPTVGQESQRLSMPRAEFSNVCHNLVQIKLWWLKIWAGESQRAVAKEQEGIQWSPGRHPAAKPFQIGWKASCYQSEVSFKVSRDQSQMPCKISSLSIRLVSEAALVSIRVWACLPSCLGFLSLPSNILQWARSQEFQITIHSPMKWEMVGKEEKRSASSESGTDTWRDLPSSANLGKEHTDHMEQRSSLDKICLLEARWLFCLLLHVWVFIIVIINMIRDLLWWDTEMFVTQNQFNHWFSISVVSALMS